MPQRPHAKASGLARSLRALLYAVAAGRGAGAEGAPEQRAREEQRADHSRRDSRDPAVTPKMRYGRWPRRTRPCGADGTAALTDGRGNLRLPVLLDLLE